MNSLMLLAIVRLRLCYKKLLLGTKSPPKELCGDEFLVSKLAPWEPLWKEKREVGIKTVKDAKVGKTIRKGSRERKGNRLYGNEKAGDPSIPSSICLPSSTSAFSLFFSQCVWNAFGR